MYKLLLAVLLLGIGVLLFLEFIQKTICDGGYELEVRVHSASQTPIAAVRYEVLFSPDEFSSDPDDMERLLKTGAYWPRLGWHVDQRPFRGEPFTIYVTLTAYISGLLERELAYHHQRALLVMVEYGDGRRTGKIVEIPDGRQTQTLSVDFP